MSPNILSSIIVKQYPRGSFLLEETKIRNGYGIRVCRRCYTTKISGHLGYLVGPTPRARCFSKNIEKRQLWVRPTGGWNSTLQAAWHVRLAHWARLCYVLFVIWCSWITCTKWLLILSSTSFMIGRSRVFYMCSWKVLVGDSPGCHQDQQDDFTRTMWFVIN